MKRSRFILSLFGLIFCFSTVSWSEEPEKVTACQLQADPSSYNHKLIEVDSFVSHDFEDFTLLDPACETWPAIWLEYGGKSKSDTMYCCGPTRGKSRPQELQVEGITIPLIEDDQFRQFDKEIQPPFRSDRYGSIVHATFVGRFFSGTRQQFGKGTPFWGGYGHMGCCSLFAIQQIKSVNPQDRNDLDYGASYDQPNITGVGCGTQGLVPLEMASELIHLQQQADSGDRAWAFDDPKRVASEGLRTLAKLDAPIPLSLKETRKAQGRIVYVGRQPGKSDSMMVVASRPYWLSLYAQDPKRVAWVVVAAYQDFCEAKRKPPVTNSLNSLAHRGSIILQLVSVAGTERNKAPVRG